MTNSMTKKEAIKLVTGPFGEATLKSVAKFAAPVFWETQQKDAPNPITNGTIFLVNYGEGYFAVTANHVYEGYRKDKAAAPETICWIAPEAFDSEGKDAIPFDLEGCLIDQLDDPDIATFMITESEAKAIGTTIVESWPPILPEIGKGVLFTGYPGTERLEIGHKELSFAPLPSLTIAKSVNKHQISCQFEHEYIVQSPGFKKPKQHYETGGMSGGPLFTIIESKGLLRWHLGGVIKEGSPSLDILFASPADCILKDGRLRR